MNNIETKINELTNLAFEIKDTQETINDLKNKINNSNKDNIKIITGGAIVTTIAITTLTANNIINTSNALPIAIISTTAITAFSTAINIATKIDNEKLNTQLKIAENNLQQLTLKYYQKQLEIKYNINYNNYTTQKIIDINIPKTTKYSLPSKKKKMTLKQQQIHEYKMH